MASLVLLCLLLSSLWIRTHQWFPWFSPAVPCKAFRSVILLVSLVLHCILYEKTFCAVSLVVSLFPSCFPLPSFSHPLYYLVHGSSHLLLLSFSQLLYYLVHGSSHLPLTSLSEPMYHWFQWLSLISPYQTFQSHCTTGFSGCPLFLLTKLFRPVVQLFSKDIPSSLTIPFGSVVLLFSRESLLSPFTKPFVSVALVISLAVHSPLTKLFF